MNRRSRLGRTVRPTRPLPAPAFLDEERRQMGDWWFRQEYLCEFVATTDQVFAYDLVMGALSDNVAPLFPDINPREHRSTHDCKE